MMTLSSFNRSVFSLLLIGAVLCPKASALSDKDLLRLAHRGDVKSMRIIGKRKFWGSPANGTRLDRENGFAWLEKAAGKGDVEAKCQIGIIYCKGNTWPGICRKVFST